MTKLDYNNLPDLKNGRLTAQKLVDWANLQFCELGIDNYEVVSIERTRFTRDQYEGGAAKLYVRCRCKGSSPGDILEYSTLLCFFSIGELYNFIKDGYEIFINRKNCRTGLFTDYEIDVRRPSNKLAAEKQKGNALKSITGQFSGSEDAWMDREIENTASEAQKRYDAAVISFENNFYNQITNEQFEQVQKALRIAAGLDTQ